jgi:hypothetical protein
VAVVPELGLPLKLWLKPERMPAGMTIDSLKDDENPGDEICAGMGDVLGPLIGDIMLLGGRFWNGCPGLLGGAGMGAVLGPLFGGPGLPVGGFWSGVAGLLGGPSRNAGGGRLFLRPGLPDGPFWNARGGRLFLCTKLRVCQSIHRRCVRVCARVFLKHGRKAQLSTWTANTASAELRLAS